MQQIDYLLSFTRHHFFPFQTPCTKLFLTIYFSADHWPYDFILWQNIGPRISVYFFVENWILYKMGKQHLDSTKCTPTKILEESLATKFHKIIYSQSVLYKFS